MQCVAQAHDGKDEAQREAWVKSASSIRLDPLHSDHSENVLGRFDIVREPKRHEEHAEGVVDAHTSEAEPLDVGSKDVAIGRVGEVGADLVAIQLGVLEDCGGAIRSA